MEYVSDIDYLCKKRMVLILDHFIHFCENNNLRYYCCAGTALGAVRHSGFIPWDDDIDVMMPRPDYEKFLKIYNSQDSKYELITPLNNKNYYLPFAKLVDKESTIVERRDVPCVLGLFVDIFPLDGMPKDRNEIQFFSESYSLNRQLLAEVSCKNGILEMLFLLLTGKIQRFLRALKFKTNRTQCRDEIVNRLVNLGNSFDYDKSEIISVEDIGDVAHPFPKEWLEPFQVMRFENIDVRLPKEYHNYLANAYGNYMQLPPKEEQINSHMESLCFFDLHERKEYDEIKYKIFFGHLRKRFNRFFYRHR